MASFSLHQSNWIIISGGDQRRSSYNPMIESDAETESPSLSSSFSGEDDDLNLGGETQRLYFDEETQKLDYDDDDDMMTQLVVDDSDTDKTEILSESETDSEDCVNFDSNAAGSEKKRSMSVFSTSVKASGQSAARSMDLMELNNVDISFSNNVLPHMNCTSKDKGKGGLRYSILDGIQVKEAEPPSNLENLDEDAKSVVRNLFREDASAFNITPTDDNNHYDEVHELHPPDSSTCDPVYIGLSYVDSQEPGEFSQANALNVVDRYLAVNPIEILSEDGYN